MSIERNMGLSIKGSKDGNSRVLKITKGAFNQDLPWSRINPDSITSPERYSLTNWQEDKLLW